MLSPKKFKPLSLLLALVVFVILLLIPQLVTSYYVISILTMASLYAIFAASWDLVAGYTGQLNLGQAFFVGAGAYTVGLLGSKIGPVGAVAAGGLISVIFALIVGFPCLRLKGPFLSLTTLVVPLIMGQLAFTFRGVSGGEFGLIITSPFNRVQLYYTALVLLAISFLILFALTRSRIGRVLQAIREDEISAAAAGNDVVLYKLLVFVVSAFLTGIGGGVLAFYLNHVGPNVFAMSQSMNIVIMGIVGGMGTIVGPIIGGYLLTIVGQLLRNTQQLQDIIYSLILISAVLLFPNGFAGIGKLLKNFAIKLPGRNYNG